jgi:hypothetical protein
VLLRESFAAGGWLTFEVDVLVRAAVTVRGTGLLYQLL